MSLLDNLLVGYTCDGDALDFSGNNYNATPVGATFTSPGKVYNQAAYFDGLDDKWLIPNIGIINTNQPFSCGGWVRYDNASGTEHLIGNGSSSPSHNGRYTVQLRRSGDLVQFFISETGIWVAFLTTDAAHLGAADTDYHVFCTYDGSQTTAGMKIYVDGSVVATTPTGTFDSTPSNWDEWTIGTNASNTSDMSGQTNQILVYDVEVSPAIISGLYNGGAGITLPPVGGGNIMMMGI
jgi:hypothetical protein